MYEKGASADCFLAELTQDMPKNQNEIKQHVKA